MILPPHTYSRMAHILLSLLHLSPSFEAVSPRQRIHFPKESVGKDKARNFFFADVDTTVTSKSGTKAELPCLVYGIDVTNIVISWWKAGDYQEVALGLETRQHRYFLPRRFYEDWTLIIKDVQPPDSGFYACQINADVLYEKIFLLNVTPSDITVNHKFSNSEFLKDEGEPSQHHSKSEQNKTSSTNIGTIEGAKTQHSSFEVSRDDDDDDYHTSASSNHILTSILLSFTIVNMLTEAVS